MLDKILENVGDMEGRVVHLDGLVTRLGEWGDKVTHTLVHHTLCFSFDLQRKNANVNKVAS